MMSHFKRRKGFFTPFSLTSCAILPHTSGHIKQLPKVKERSTVLSPVHIGRHVQTITPKTKQKIKQRFACGFSDVSTNDTSPGIYVPFELSQTSCISHGSFDKEEKTYLKENRDFELNDGTTALHLSASQTILNTEEDSETECGRNSDVTNATDEPAKDEKESNFMVKYVIAPKHEAMTLQNNGDVNEPIPGPRLNTQKRDATEESGIDILYIDRQMKRKKTDEESHLTRNSSFKMKMTCRKMGNEAVKMETTGLRALKEMKKRDTISKLHKPTGSGGRCNKKRDDFCSLSMSCKFHNGKTRKRKCKRSFQMVKQGVLTTLKKMHNEIQELLERRKMLFSSGNDSADEGRTTNIQKNYYEERKTIWCNKND